MTVKNGKSPDALPFAMHSLESAHHERYLHVAASSSLRDLGGDLFDKLKNSPFSNLRMPIVGGSGPFRGAVRGHDCCECC